MFVSFKGGGILLDYGERLTPYKHWLRFPVNKNFYDLMSPLFLFYAYNCKDPMNEYVKCYKYLSLEGQEELLDMICYLIYIDIIRPNSVNLDNFTFTFTVNATPKEIVDKF